MGTKDNVRNTILYLYCFPYCGYKRPPLQPYFHFEWCIICTLYCDWFGNNLWEYEKIRLYVHIWMKICMVLWNRSLRKMWWTSLLFDYVDPRGALTCYKACPAIVQISILVYLYICNKLTYCYYIYYNHNYINELVYPK